MSHEHRGDDASDEISVNPLFARRAESAIPRWRIPDDEMLPETAYQIIHDELLLDGNARQNLATFVTTWMEPQATRLYAEAFDKNLVDKDEYPQTAAIEERCLHVLADLWNASDPHATVGTSAMGSSEACMLAGLVFKRRWQIARRAAGKSTASPNIVFSSAVQVVWEKFANYWEVEPRYVPITKEQPYLTVAGMLSAIDENTIGVVAVLGVTYNGVYEPVKELADALDDLETRRGLDVPLHVDAASGGFIAPFLDPDLEWDFRVSRVHSISASGHKFGLVYPGVGWILWAKREYLPEELIFNVSYLGGDMPTLGLNFSRPGAQVLLQYYNFLRLGREGYRRVMQASKDAAGFLALVRRLRSSRGEIIYAPGFSRDLEESIAGALPIEPNVQLVVVEGNYLLVPEEPWSELRDLFDEVWYCERDEQARVANLIARHRVYGKSEDEARRWALGPDQRNAELIARTRSRADLIARLDGQLADGAPTRTGVPTVASGSSGGE